MNNRVIAIKHVNLFASAAKKKKKKKMLETLSRKLIILLMNKDDLNIISFFLSSYQIGQDKLNVSFNVTISINILTFYLC